MTGTDLVPHQTSTSLVRLDTEQLKYIANSDFVPKTYRGNLPAIMACVATGRELGIGDLEALRSIHVIDGRPSLSAELMVKLARQRGHSITGETTSDRCVVRGKRGDNGDEFVVTFTLEDAESAGLLAKDNWKRYPADMLWARSVSRLCRRLFPDVTGHMLTPDEAELPVEQRIMEATEGLPLPKEEDGAGTPSTPDAPSVGDVSSSDSEQATFPIPESAKK